MEIVQSD